MVGALAATLLALVVPVSLFGGARPAAAGAPAWNDDGEGVRDTPSGPLTALDRDFVRKVRLAGLWEKPAGRLAQERGTTENVRVAGEHLIGGHSELDRRSLDAARTLGIALPDRPNEQQQGWLDEIDAAARRRNVELASTRRHRPADQHQRLRRLGDGPLREGLNA
ncbi:DUF4142 domain-containing protein [Streptomyces roseoverticillatus]|uniref:DUF4142 domain-containing protein n=1 Tax=Streptomyces roseoverticillatus TaxID=66429 RepID=A0ABV3J3P0_9ACTN